MATWGRARRGAVGLRGATHDDSGKVDAKSGVATLTGTVGCNKHSFVSTSFGKLSQKVGRHSVKGLFGVTTECDGTVPWSAMVQGDSGPFVGGKATATLLVFGFSSETGESSQPSVSKTIVLMGGGTSSQASRCSRRRRFRHFSGASLSAICHVAMNTDRSG